jgi:hypothetical protein
MKMFYQITFILVGFFMLGISLQAKARTCRVIYPERPNDAPKIAYLFDGSDSQKVALPSMNFSKVIELPSGDITIAMTQDSVSDPEALSPSAPLLKISESVTDFYILIIPDPKNKDFPVKMKLVDSGQGKLKPGETLWFNLTEHRIVARLGGAKMLVAPKGRAVSKDPVSASGYYSAKFAYQVKGKGALAPITEQSWWHDAESRHLGFMLNSGGRLPKIYFYRDFRPK